MNLTNSTGQSSGANRHTIGSTTISSSEAEIIKKEVRDIVQKAFPGINVNTAHPVPPNRRSGVSDTGKPSSGVIDLAGSMAHSAPLAIAGSEVSVASTLSNSGQGESNTSFSRIMSGSGAVTSAQTFATAQWRPKEPPCYYGRSTEDVHTWTSLVRHYLTFMGGNDAQQVAYAITLLRDAAHEWYMAYERKIVKCPEIGLS